MYTFVEPSHKWAPQETSTQQSKRCQVTEVQTRRKTASVGYAIWDRAKIKGYNWWTLHSHDSLPRQAVYIFVRQCLLSWLGKMTLGPLHPSSLRKPHSGVNVSKGLGYRDEPFRMECRCGNECQHRWTTATVSKRKQDKQIQKIETLMSTLNWDGYGDVSCVLKPASSFMRQHGFNLMKTLWHCQNPLVIFY